VHLDAFQWWNFVKNMDYIIFFVFAETTRANDGHLKGVCSQAVALLNW
jgi:hypothetical protein